MNKEIVQDETLTRFAGRHFPALKKLRKERLIDIQRKSAEFAVLEEYIQLREAVQKLCIFAKLVQQTQDCMVMYVLKHSTHCWTIQNKTFVYILCILCCFHK